LQSPSSICLMVTSPRRWPGSWPSPMGRTSLVVVVMAMAVLLLLLVLPSPRRTCRCCWISLSAVPADVRARVERDGCLQSPSRYRYCLAHAETPVRGELARVRGYALPSINQVCTECGHSACQSCFGRPEHCYEAMHTHLGARIAPRDFEQVGTDSARVCG
jgi:hypothetical protein